ncbi:MAG: shikimate dehydrogenase [Blautia sp.]|nr:shikimate dehydrogenase [Blautia sp.]
MYELPSITGHTGFMGLLGSPVRHSFSPVMHNTAFRILGLDYVYLCFEVGEEELAHAVEGLRICGISGFNLTMPNKTRILELLDVISPEAALIGAVNTVVCKDGKLCGYNTDGFGYMKGLAQSGIHVIGKEITVLGAGGAATAIIAQAALDGVSKINVFYRPSSRFAPKMKHLADQIGSRTACRIEQYAMEDSASLKKALQSSVLLANATSVGMAPHEDETPLQDMSLLRSGLAVTDVIYHPGQTRLLKEAASIGCPTLNGLPMLLWQGAKAFELWTGRQMPVENIRPLLPEM